MKQLFLSILFTFCVTICGCEMDKFDYTNYVDMKFYSQVENPTTIECEVYHENVLVKSFVLNESNHYTHVEKLIYNEYYTLSTNVSGVVDTRTFVADYSYSVIKFTITVDPTVDEIEDEIIFEF